MTKPHGHATYHALIARLKRAGGHLVAVISMIEECKPWIGIAQRLQAVRKAVVNAKRALIHDHIDRCLTDDGAGRGGHDLTVIKALTRLL